MKNRNIQTDFIHFLMEKFSKKNQLANFISTTLFIEKDSAYRRLRGEVPFSLQEASILAKKLNISFDELMEFTSSKVRPFFYNKINYINPEKPDYELLENHLELLKDITQDTHSEMAVNAKIIPKLFYLDYGILIRFHYLKWIYQYGNGFLPQLSEISISTPMMNIYKEMTDLFHQMKQSVFILHKHLFRNLAEDISYFTKLELINPDDLKSLKEALLHLLDDMENTAINGRNKCGNKIYFYVSELNFEIPFYCIRSAKYKMTALRTFVINDVISSDSVIFDDVYRCIQSLKKSSIQISESGEIQRKNYFNEQRSIIESL